jgi:hypothetical protein
MELKIPESLDCVEPNNYTSLSFRIKIVKPSQPANMKIYLFSEKNDKRYFFYSLDSNEVKTGFWNNKTIPLNAFKEVNGANWHNITSIKIELTWQSVNDITVLIDGVFFHGYYKSLLEISGGAIVANSVISGFMQFTIQWAILGIVLYLFSRLFRAQPVFKTILSISGFVLITFFIQNLILIGVILAYPKIHISLETLGGVPGEGLTPDVQNFMSIMTIKYDVLDRLVYLVWIVALCSVAVRLLFEFPWTRCVSVSFLSSVISMLAFRFLIYGGVWL